MGDMNLNKIKFTDKNYKYKALRDILLNCLGRNDVKAADLGPTYHSRTYETSSELDHIYYSSTLMKAIRYKVHNSCATDHSPTLAEIELVKKEDPKYDQYIVVRNMRNFDQVKFNNDLVAQQWEEMGRTENLDVMTEIFMGMIKDSFERHAPQKKIKVHPNHVNGLSDDTKKLMAKEMLQGKIEIEMNIKS